MIHYVSMNTNDIKSTGASLFQPVLFHGVHSSVSKYLGDSIMPI